MNYLKRFLTLALLTLFLFSTQNTTFANAPQINLPKIGETSISTNTNTIILSDERTVVTGTRNGELVFVDSKTTQTLNTVKVTNEPIYQIIEQNRDNIVFTTYPAKIWKYTISTGEVREIYSAALSSNHDLLLADSNHLLIKGNSDLFLINLANGELIWQLEAGRTIVDWAYNANEKEIALAFYNGTINIYNISTFSFQQTIKFETTSIEAVDIEFAHNENLIYVWHKTNSNHIPSLFVKKDKIYEKSHLLLKPEYLNTLYTFELSEDDRFMIISSNKAVSLFDLTSGEKIYSNTNLMRYTIRQINWLTPKNKLLVHSEYTIGYLDTTELQKLASLKEIKVDTLQQTLYVGNEYPLHGYFVFSDGTHEPFDASKLDWHVNDFYKAGLENGKIITREPGKVTFTANYLGHTLSVSKVIHSHKPQDADQYVEQEKATNVPADKVWEVTVNGVISYKNIQQKDIFVTDDTGMLVPTVYVIDTKTSASKIKIVPAGEYESGKTYTLWIKNLSSSTGQNLGNKVKMDFTIK